MECGGKFSQVWPKLHLLSIWRWKRAPIARLVSLSVIWGGPPVFQVASSQTWGRARPRGETPSPGVSAPPLRSLSHGGSRSRLRSSSCGVEGGKRILGPKEYESAIRVKSAMNLAESPFVLILDCTCSHRWRRPGEKRKRTEIFVSTLGHCFLAHLEHYAAAWVHSATLWENRPLNASTGEWHHDFQDFVRKSVRRCCGASARVLCPGCGQRVLFVASTLVTSSVTTKVSKSREGRRESAHQRSLSRLETVPPRWASLASLSPVMGLDPPWWTSDGS